MNLLDLRQALPPDMEKLRLEELMVCLVGLSWTASPGLSPALGGYSSPCLSGWETLGRQVPAESQGQASRMVSICTWLLSCLHPWKPVCAHWWSQSVGTTDLT